MGRHFPVRGILNRLDTSGKITLVLEKSEQMLFIIFSDILMNCVYYVLNFFPLKKNKFKDYCKFFLKILEKSGKKWQPYWCGST